MAVFLAAVAAQVVAFVFYRRNRRGVRWGRDPRVVEAVNFLLLLVTAAMMGHMFARIDPAKWWLFPMMSGGLALAFVIPALWSGYNRRRVRRALALRDALYWMLAYLAMGGVFYLLR
ncbi:DUF1761 domain-containing protein [Pseudopontixanthobacter vadosimaris]|uniref:DUF1761 domain-containing protein n=1 Tax=Pseudopontixanthobacter vadosimaris TaxID=2726450 RepID=UPI001F1182DE|nr:DUF1761 domain-containing protein [Pseudopontixanthobacter vadosimaris]